MKINYFIKGYYDQIKKLQSIREYVIATKENFLNENFYNMEMQRIEKEIEDLREKIKQYK